MQSCNAKWRGQRERQNKHANKKKQHVSLATTTKTTTTLHVQHTSFLHFFVVVLTTTASSFLVTRFLEGMSHVLTKNFVSCVPARSLFHCRSFSPYWPLKFIISIFKFNFFFVFVFCFISRFSPFSVKTRLCCCCCFSFSKSSGGQDDHNIDVYHHVKHRLQPRHRKTDHFTLVTVWCGRKDGCMDGRKGVRSRDNQNFSHAWITKFSYPGCSTGELRYTSFNYHPDFLEAKDK